MRTTIAAAIVMAPVFAGAQEIDTVPVDFSRAERSAILQMCETARWASRIQYDMVCDSLKLRFGEAEAKARAAAKPAENPDAKQ